MGGAARRRQPPRSRGGAAAGRRVKLRPQDAFDLIRLLARSQSDPRKALAELVQNSLDAGAQRIEIQWFNDKGRRSLSIWDDGRGVFPDMDRPEALRRIAQTIGHSHKRDLTPAQRREELILGKYGIGLIGFWSVGETLEMRSRVAGDKAHVLRMYEEREQGEVFASRSRRLDEPDTFTEVTIRGVHDAVVNRVRPPRLQAFLATELRGQLLERGATVRIRDRVARGRARKEFVVQPQPYLGQRIEGLGELEVPGFESARLELYLVEAGDERRGVVALACGGTVVLDDIAEIDGAGTLRPPWGEGRLEGVIDFPDLHVAPASRRGFAHDEPVAAFLQALVGLEQDLRARLEQQVARRAALHQERVAREIRKAFASVAESLPDYDFFDVRAPSAEGDPAPEPDAPRGPELGDNPPAPESDEARVPPLGQGDRAEGDAVGASATESATRASGDERPGAAAQAEPRRPRGEQVPPGHDPPAVAGASDDEATEDRGLLFPPGPLDAVELRPTRARLPAGASRRFRARAVDADGRGCVGELEFHWALDGGLGELVADGASAMFTAPERLGESASTGLEVRVTHYSGGERVDRVARAAIQVDAPDATERVQGIPEPHPVSAPGERWRSRVVGGRWEFNEAHPDFRAVAEAETRRLRYLIHLFAKEVVLRNFGRPGDSEVLERMVEVLTRLDGPRRPGRA